MNLYREIVALGNIKLNKNDTIISCSSGIITGAMDALWIEDLSLVEAHSWGTEQTNKFVIKVAKNKGYKGQELAGAIDYLEGYAPIWADKTTSDFGGGLHHHLRDFSHHPTLVGLIFSLLNEFTGYGYGTNTKGEFICVKIDGWHRKGFLESIYSGTVNWTLHLISDIAGSSGSVRMGKEGTGIPGPLMSTLKEISTIPGLSEKFGQDEKGNNVLSVACQKLFNGTLLAEHDENGKIIKDSVVKFDMRTELGLAHEPIRTKQYIPILICEGIICAFYSVSRLFRELKDKSVNSIDDIKRLDFSKFLPWKNDELKRMRTISALSFSTVDMSCAAVSSYLESDGDKTKFALGIAKRVNYFGVGRLIVAGTGEIGMKLEKTYDEYGPIVERLTKETIPVNGDVKDVAEKGASSYFAIAGMGTPVGFVAAAIGVFKEIKTSSDEYKAAREERIRIEQECDVAIQMLQEYRDEMELVVSEYMVEHLTVFGEGLDMMDSALESDDTDKFIQGNNMIQKELGRDSSFSSQDEFDDLMLSDGDFKL